MKLLRPSLLIWVCVALVIIIVYLLKTYGIEKNMLLLVSALSAVTGVMFSQAIKLHSEMVARGFELLKSNRQDEEFAKQAKIVVDYFRTNNPLDLETAKVIFRSEEQSHEELRWAIRVVANYFEQMAIGILHGDVSEHLLRDYYQGIFIRFYNNIKGALPVFRSESSADGVYQRPGLKRPEVYLMMEKLYNRWSPGYQRMI